MASKGSNTVAEHLLLGGLRVYPVTDAEPVVPDKPLLQGKNLERTKDIFGAVVLFSSFRHLIPIQIVAHRAHLALMIG
jgi:hypothetical protein